MRKAQKTEHYEPELIGTAPLSIAESALRANPPGGTLGSRLLRSPPFGRWGDGRGASCNRGANTADPTLVVYIYIHTSDSHPQRGRVVHACSRQLIRGNEATIERKENLLEGDGGWGRKLGEDRLDGWHLKATEREGAEKQRVEKQRRARTFRGGKTVKGR